MRTSSLIALIIALFYLSNLSHASVYSNNWAGYYINANQPGTNTITFVNGTFTVPSVSHSSVSSIEYTNVLTGIGGYSNSNMISAGVTGEDANGNITYYSWYQLYPANAVKINMKVRPGDSILAQIKLVNPDSMTWQIHISDISLGESYTTNVIYKKNMNDAEWVVEAPKSGGKVDLAPFSPLGFSNQYASECASVSCDSTFFIYQMTQLNPNQLSFNQSGGAGAYPSGVTSTNLFDIFYTGIPSSLIKTSIKPGNYDSNVDADANEILSARLYAGSNTIANQSIAFYANDIYLGSAYTNTIGFATLKYNTSHILPNISGYGTISIPMTAEYTGDSVYNSSSLAFKVSLRERQSRLAILQGSTKTLYAGGQANFSSQLTTGNVPIENQVVYIKIVNQTYREVTNSNGIVQMYISPSNLQIGNNEVTVHYNGTMVYNSTNANFTIEMLTPNVTVTTTLTTTIVQQSNGVSSSQVIPIAITAGVAVLVAVTYFKRIRKK